MKVTGWSFGLRRPKPMECQVSAINSGADQITVTLRGPMDSAGMTKEMKLFMSREEIKYLAEIAGVVRR